MYTALFLPQMPKSGLHSPLLFQESQFDIEISFFLHCNFVITSTHQLAGFPLQLPPKKGERANVLPP